MFNEMSTFPTGEAKEECVTVVHPARAQSTNEVF